MRCAATSALWLLVGLLASGAATAQIAPPRTWPELKEAVLDRVNRQAYPLTGMAAADVKEILDRIGSLDRNEWPRASPTSRTIA
jgi:hypothetical protein